MPSCLGIYTDKNMIKYAKVTSVADKMSGRQYITVDNYGVKFYENIQASLAEIANEVGLEQTPLGLTLSNESYYMTQVFSNLKKKDMMELIGSEYAEKSNDSGVPIGLLERRIKLAVNSGSLDKSLALCVFTTQGELANLNQNFSAYKIGSVSPIAISIKNIFENQAIDEEAAVINIEGKTTITLFHRSEIQYIASLPMGANSILSALTEKYNSSAKAYEALKKISVYLEDSYDIDDECREILDVVIPTLYEIRQQADAMLTPYLKDVKKIYITGTAAVINNIDLYFEEIFQDVECEIVKPFFVPRDDSNAKEIIEVNSAVALALDGLGMLDDDFNFNAATKKAAGVTALKETIGKMHIKEKVDTFKVKSKEIVNKLNAPVQPKKKKKRNVAFDEGLVSGDSGLSNAGDDAGEETSTSGLGRLDAWLLRATVLSLTLFGVYYFSAKYTNEALVNKKAEVDAQISKVNSAITLANNDSEYLQGQADGYVEITEKLATLIEKINHQTSKAFNIPNLLSKIMFIIPANVQITNISVAENGNVTIDAQSGQYAQLGYFVSRIKLENILAGVDMEVAGTEGDIKIIVRGVLP